MSKKSKHSSVTVNGVTSVSSNTYKCHTGNIVVMHSTKKNGGRFLCGGWSRGAVSDDVAVIDLTGTEPLDVENPMKAKNEPASQWFGATIATAAQGRELPWLSFKVKDFGVPTVQRETWVQMAKAIAALMDAGHDVLIACNGGHGRTGTAASILCYLMNNEVGDPVTYLRSVYCNDAVETREQHKYVHKMLNLPEPVKLEYKHDPKPGAWSGVYGAGGYGGVWQVGQWQPGQTQLSPGAQGGSASTWKEGYVWSQTLSRWIPPEGHPDYTGDQPATQDSLGSITSAPWQSTLIDALEAITADYTVVTRKLTAPEGRYTQYVEVCIPTSINSTHGLDYYEVIGYDVLTKTVRLESPSTGSSRQVPIDFLASTTEVERYYGQGR